MARRSLQASELGALAIKKALKQKKWPQDFLAGKAGCSRQTIWSLLQSNPVDCDVFMAVCKHLGLNWEEIAKPDQPEAPVATNAQLDALVQQARSQIQPYTQERCGSMRVLDMTQPIDLDNLYIQVNILHKLTRLRSAELAELLREGGLETFDRFCMGGVQQERVPGLEAVAKFSKLMILGKPGAGKTTFLKHLAMQCLAGRFQGDRVPFFITLKEFAETKGQPGVLEFCDRLAGAKTIEPFRNNRALVLLDGLDEVRETDASRVLNQIRGLSTEFPGNQFVVTCRIAAREYVFERFTEVEVADFSREQVAEFVGNWFRHKQDPVKAERFLEKVKEEGSIAELSTSPLLLTLLCLVFEDSGSFPSNRAELYETGVGVLLNKWDKKRNIEREQVYKGLSLKRKEDLLSYVARATFEAGNYFFKKREAEWLIGEYIQNLPNADPAALEVDSGAVLKSVEAQHGLFVERARQIYSFSHLTFHEYFAARWIVEARDSAALQALAAHVTEPRWREVFLRVTELLPNADEWLRTVKTEADSLLAGDEKLQAFLRWTSAKMETLTFSYKPSAVRAFFLANHISIKTLPGVKRMFYHTIDGTMPLNRGLYFSHKLEDDLMLDYALILTISVCRDKPPIDCELYQSFYCAWELSKAIHFALNQELSLLYEKLTAPKGGFQKWWKANGKAWTTELQNILIQYRNIGHDWQFIEKQQQLLQQYYDANKLLIACLNSDCYVSREVRQEIEDTLLLPISEIEKRVTQK
jgi:predicted NACHT family NTPase